MRAQKVDASNSACISINGVNGERGIETRVSEKRHSSAQRDEICNTVRRNRRSSLATR